MDKKKRRICIVIPTHWDFMMGGAQYQAKCLVDKLISINKYEIIYLARRVNTSITCNGYTVLKIKNYSKMASYCFFLDAPQLLFMLRKLKPDVIYQRVGCAYTGITAYHSKHHNCKHVWHVAHDDDVKFLKCSLSKKLLFKYIEKKILEYGIQNANCIVTQTNHQNKLLQRNYGRTATAIIPNFHPLPGTEIIKTNPIIVMWVANLKAMKQPDLFINLARRFKGFEGVQFLMIGRPLIRKDLYNRLMKEISSLDNLTYLGECTQNEVNDLLAKADIFVNTSLYEGFANTFIQAWMRKVPVVSLNVNPDGVFDNKQIGFMSGDEEKMYEDVSNLINDHTLRREMGDQAQKYAFKHHSEKNIKILTKILDD